MENIFIHAPGSVCSSAISASSLMSLFLKFLCHAIQNPTQQEKFQRFLRFAKMRYKRKHTCASLWLQHELPLLFTGENCKMETLWTPWVHQQLSRCSQLPPLCAFRAQQHTQAFLPYVWLGFSTWEGCSWISPVNPESLTTFTKNNWHKLEYLKGTSPGRQVSFWFTLQWLLSGIWTGRACA